MGYFDEPCIPDPEQRPEDGVCQCYDCSGWIRADQECYDIEGNIYCVPCIDRKKTYA